jgi:uncharacterized membrane protein YbhN (UPF0104 family)
VTSSEHAHDGGQSSKPKHTWWWVIALIAFGALGVYIAAPDADVLRGALARLRDVPAAATAIVIAGAIGLVITEAIRIAAIAWLLGERVSSRDAWDAAVANHVMTAITPQVGLGEPTVAYTLAKRGMPWDGAVAVPFVKFTTSLALVFALGTLLVALGYGPPVAQWMTSTAVVWFGAIALVATTVVVVFSSERLGARWIRGIASWLARRRVFASEPRQRRIASTRDVALRTVTRLARMRGADPRDDARAALDDNAELRDDNAALRDNNAALRGDNAALRGDNRAALRGDNRAALRDDNRAALRDDNRAALRDDDSAALRDDDRATLPDDRAVLRGDARATDARLGTRTFSPITVALVLVAVHLVYYASYIAPLVGLALVLGDPPFVELCLRALVYLCFVFAMPTPGGAGPSEAAAAWFFGDLVAPADAIAIVVVFRASTFYLQLAIGALYLPIRRVAR